MTLEEAEAAAEKDRLNDMDAMKVKYEKALTAFYAKVATQGLDKVPQIIKTNAGEENFLLESLIHKWKDKPEASEVLANLKYAIENMLKLREQLAKTEQNVAAAQMEVEARAVTRM
tara:strand:- start:253 stop:600 length:348 start_codon:yes stop_codon:yes gene_type:complete